MTSGQALSMRPWRTLGQKALVALLCLSLVAWSIAPTVLHVPKVSETLQEHAEMVADHGHSHGLLQDLLWASHGHSHDAVDHDHSQALAVLGDKGIFGKRDSWQLRQFRNGSYRVFRIERPPRA
ncbi:hypothetical protein [Fodinicurvata sp. EGI_FJ10296]|uniref:hypothetical protein n=1 Tax=Fodinicurvata sp. EGI_FJ10296 TaxID=3231908 RepID=UPI0034555EC3